MRYSEYFIPTLKEEPGESEIASHALCLRAGLIRKIASGIYSFLPLGFRVLKKIENIVREEMNKAGAIELLLPVMQPSDLWIKSERWNEYGPEMFRLKDRSGRDFCLGPTHEELITYLAYLDIKSYRDLPINLYQIQVKFRDEIRPRYGLLRAREFIMKDAYSFCENEEDLEKIYQKMYKAYSRVLERIGLDFKVVEAETGLIGGKYSHEFIVLAKNGEEQLVYCPDCGYSANYEMSGFICRDSVDNDVNSNFREDNETREVYTPDITDVKGLAKFLKIPISKIVKTMLLIDSSNKIYAFLLSGDRDLNIKKAEKFLNLSLGMVGGQKIPNNLNIGYLGPVNISSHIEVYADNSIRGKSNFAVGANKKNYHLINVNYPGDFTVKDWGDFTFPLQGDRCINCGRKLKFEKGIEIGHIFKLGKKYSKKLDAKFLGRDGKLKSFIMGCYGIGISRILSAAVEQLHDDKGIKWPFSIAPFMVSLIITNVRNKLLVDTAERVYSILGKMGIEVLYDDRDISAGVKFKDSDLIGIPLRFIVGKKFLENKKIDVDYREDCNRVEIAIEEINRFIEDFRNKNNC